MKAKNTPAQNTQDITLREHMIRIRFLVKNNARDPKKMRAAAMKRWQGKRKKDFAKSS